MTNDKAKKLIMQCPHCSNKTPHEDIFRWKSIFHKTKWSEEYEYYHILQCQTCDGVTLKYMNDIILDYTGEEDEGIPVVNYDQLYPFIEPFEGTINWSLYKYYKEIITSRHYDTSHFLTNSRKFIESVCEEKKAKGDNLEKKINYIAGKENWSQHIKEMAHLIRALGNKGSHPYEIDSKAVKLVEFYLTTVFRYLFKSEYMINEGEELLQTIKQSESKQQ